jgi:hypothetical protein
VQQGARHEQVRIQVTVLPRDEPAKPGQREHMLEQAAQIGMVNVLGRRRALVAPHGLFVVEEQLQQRAQVRVGHLADELPEFGQHLGGVAPRGGQVVGQIDLLLLEPPQLVNDQLRTVVVDLKAAFDLDEIVALKGADHLGDVVPHLGLDLAGAVAQGHRQVRLAGLLLPEFLGVNQQRGENVFAGLKLAEAGELAHAATSPNSWSSPRSW